MATGGPDLFAWLSEEILTCEICSEEFHSSTRPPRVLPCYHCYCGVCMGKLTEHGKLKCPKCRQETAADKPFPMETVRVSLLDWKQSVFTQKRVSCSNCGEGSKASSKCQDCAEFYCSDCTSQHQKFKATRDHTLVPLSEAAKSPEKLLQTVNEKCDRHPDEELTLYCLSCCTAVCSSCAVTADHKGHKCVALPKVLEDLKEKILAVCEQLDKSQEGFREKVEASEASLQTLESNHRKAEKEVKDAFSSVVSTAMERQAEALEELTAKVERERLQLEDQLATFKSLQAATQSAADYGRRLVSMSLASQLTKTSADLERTAAVLKQKLTTPVAAAATFKVGTEKVEELRALLRSLGTIRRFQTTPLSVVVPVGGRGQPIVLPDIMLDGSRCHGDCTVSADGCTLTNQPHPPSPSQSQQKFRFRGTCGTVALPGQTCYWQVHLKALPKPQIAEKLYLCEVGVASMEALQASGEYMSERGHTALTVRFIPSGGSVKVRMYHCGKQLASSLLAPFSPHSPVERTLGFLLDVQRKRLAILDVDSRQVLCEREVTMSQPLWPCVNLRNLSSETRASVSVRMVSGEHVTLTPDMVSLLKT